ncbi:MAG: phage portal protein [Micromonosporaceae bacterium]
MHLPWSRPSENTDLSVSDPALAEWFGVAPTFSGVSVGEGAALGIPALYRACALISGTIASLPLKTYRDISPGERQQVGSFLDDPGGPVGPTPFEWKETVVLHLVLHSNAFLAHVFNQAGGIAHLIPVHPGAVQVDPPTASRPFPVYKARLTDRTLREFTPATMTHIVGPTVAGHRGMSLIQVARQSLGTTIAADRAAARMFGNGALISGLVSAEEDVDADEAKTIKEGLDRKLGGWENAGEVAFVNRKLKFTPWTMNAEEAQFLESRQFQIEEVARWTGVPPHLLMQTEKQTSWGTGVAEQNRGLARFTLLPWTRRIEERLSRLLARPRFVEFEYAGLERPTPEQEIQLLIQQLQAGLLTVDEARKIRNLPPLDTPDQLELEPGRENAEVTA